VSEGLKGAQGSLRASYDCIGSSFDQSSRQLRDLFVANIEATWKDFEILVLDEAL
jgi:hypothetical protein